MSQKQTRRVTQAPTQAKQDAKAAPLVTTSGVEADVAAIDAVLSAKVVAAKKKVEKRYVCHCSSPTCRYSASREIGPGDYGYEQAGRSRSEFNHPAGAAG